MQIALSSADRQVTLPLTVKQIQAQRVLKSSGDDDLFDEYYRTIRFITLNGDAVDVDCSAYEAQDLAIVEVAELPPCNKAERERLAAPRYDGSQT
jgi:hypothetical protein